MDSFIILWKSAFKHLEQRTAAFLEKAETQSGDIEANCLELNVEHLKLHEQYVDVGAIAM